MPGLGVEFAHVVEDVLGTIESSPLRFPVARADIRRAVLRRFPYVVYFVVLPELISVIAVLHGRRDPTVWQSRR